MTEPVVPAVPVVEAGVAPTVDQAPAVVPSETDWKAEAEKWKAFSRKNEDTAKSNAAAAKELQEFKDRDLSELQRAQKTAEEYKTRAETAERARLRSDVALSKGLPPEVVSALVGDTAEELTAHADALLAWRGTAAPVVVPQPRPDASQGAQLVSPDAIADSEYQSFQAAVFPNRR